MKNDAGKKSGGFLGFIKVFTPCVILESHWTRERKLRDYIYLDILMLYDTIQVYDFPCLGASEQIRH